MRRVLLFVAVAATLTGTAAAATIRGSGVGELLRGTPAPDRIDGRAGDDRIAVAFGGVDTVACGPGRDIVAADRSDRVARDCEVVARRISTDTSTNAASQHETAVEPDSFAWGSTVVATFQVGRFADGGSSTIGWATSTDAGRTWQTGGLPSLTVESAPPGDQTRASDPAVAYDALHGVWLIASLTIAPGTSNIRVSRSRDGVHWDSPVQVAGGPILDKEWIACDNGAASPFHGRCYVVYTDDALHQITLQSSGDGGLTWSGPVRVSGTLIGVQPAIRPDGSLVVLAADLPGDEGPDEGQSTGSIIAVRSTDGGVTFAPPAVAAELQWKAVGMRAIPLPSAAVDAAGTIYAAWHDCRFHSGCSANDIVIVSSSDGITWNPVRRVPTEAIAAGVDHFITGLDADPGPTGRLGLVYAFFEPGSCDQGPCRLEMAFISSRNGGASWSKQQLLDPQSFPLTWIARTDSGRMVGDYFSVSFAGGRVVPVFTLASPPLNGRFREAIFAASLSSQSLGKRP